ncbi:D-alanyl-D-alanine carboxypeptidase [Microbacterium sp. ET2]|uniref:D-alanyl-D-alanine carboxypeptidase family protein n=1 Tax=Microbacterium albipurpureum TaxID=3050384 RepID=UPI00259CD2C1|nr:D-alanyl-D-alanine carboxypeptidase [Microbacterium sp. ET2 (Ac-2212)]WJL97143.1 D-alanyl-D-alanine carboxypeptidase [Microbacterium sp. ET2 (Ac-2212)]
MTAELGERGDFADFDALMRDAARAPEGLSDVDPDRRGRRRWIGWTVAAVILALVIGAPSAYVTWALTAPLPAPEATFTEPAVPLTAAASLSLPAQGSSAVSVTGVDEYLGAEAAGIWATSGPQEPAAMASITKLITALVVLDAHPLASPDDQGPTLWFDGADEDLYDAYYVQNVTIAPMLAGSSMTLRGALATMLIPSASNYADVVSTWAFGSRAGFVAAARAWLDDHGLAQTTVVDPTGISPRNTSTPADLIALGRIAAAHSDIAGIVGTRSATIGSAGNVNNTNGLLGTAGITGLKTGNLGAGTFAFLYTSRLDVGVGTPLSVVGVMLGGESRDAVNGDVLRLLGSIQAGFSDVPLVSAGQELGEVTTPWGGAARMVTASRVDIRTWSDTPITVTSDIRTPETYADGGVVGTITWTAGPRTATVDVVIEGEIESPTEWWRLTHPSELGG